MNILITGGAGYVGSVLIPQLIEDGHNIKCLDRFFFGNEYLSHNQFKNKLELIKADIRWFDSKILEDVDVVLDLAAISNDPAGDLNPEKTYEINHKGRARVAKLSKEQGVKKYILASSASIYGQQDNIANENAEVKPLTAYSKANRNAEIDNCEFDGVISTLCGIVGSIQANEVVKEIVKIGESLCGYILIIDALKLSFRKVKLNRRSDCFCNEK